jgi:Txe/YoeB family toxin of Txe-Axe toxin-antitoxin module
MQEQETMPNDTVEVTVDETNKAIQTSEQEPSVEVTETPSEEESKPKVEDETVEYSASVKKRIDKLTKRLREAERREESALQYAQGVQKEANDIKSKYETLDKNYIDEFGSRVNNQLDLAKNKLKNAIATRNVDQQIEANEEIARLTIDAERLKYSKQIQEQKKPEENVQNQVQTQVNQQVPKPKADPKAVEWAEKNDWFGEDPVMTEAAKAIHKNLVLQEKIDPSTDLYYDKLDEKIREYFPQKFNQGGSPEVAKVAQPVASATRTNKASGRRTVKLSPSQAAMAKRLGVTLEQYAKYVKEA